MEHTFLSRRSIKFLENKIKSIWGRLMIAYETSPAIMGHPFQIEPPPPPVFFFYFFLLNYNWNGWLDPDDYRDSPPLLAACC
jgi:hypothetical protein